MQGLLVYAPRFQFPRTPTDAAEFRAILEDNPSGIKCLTWHRLVLSSLEKRIPLAIRRLEMTLSAACIPNNKNNMPCQLRTSLVRLQSLCLALNDVTSEKPG